MKVLCCYFLILCVVKISLNRNSFLRDKKEDEVFIQEESNHLESPYKVEKLYKEDLIEGWFAVSSLIFRNEYKFPKVYIYNGEKIKIIVDHYNFRINQGYNKSDNPNKPPEFNSFFFRISDRLIYFTSSITDVNVLGTIESKNIYEIKKVNTAVAETEKINFCFSIDDNDGFNWNICNKDRETLHKFYCTLKKQFNMSDLTCEKIEINKKVIIRNITQPFIVIPIPSRQCNDDWNYLSNGRDWECECIEGKKQSPIKLPHPDKCLQTDVTPEIEFFEFNKLNDSMLELTDNYLRLIAGGNENIARIVTKDGTVYNSNQIIFHTPGEHMIEDNFFDMEMQIVFNGISVGDIAKQVLFCFLLKRNPGIYNDFINDMDYFNLPNFYSRKNILQGVLFIPKIFYNSEFPDKSSSQSNYKLKNFSFYTYEGSLTKPPCSERTIVYVVSDIIPVSSTAIDLFSEALKIKDKNVNHMMDRKSNRAIQDTNKRFVYHTNCIPEENKVVDTGHYEKIKVDVMKYFYVDGSDPSHLPGAFVVDQKEATLGELPL